MCLFKRFHGETDRTTPQYNVFFFFTRPNVNTRSLFGTNSATFAEAALIRVIRRLNLESFSEPRDDEKRPKFGARPSGDKAINYCYENNDVD